MLSNQKNMLNKIIATSFLLFLTFFLELISHNTINTGSPCHYAFFKIEFIFLILIGFLFGFKYSFFANLAYLLIHFTFEYYIIESLGLDHSHSHEHGNQHNVFFLTFLYRYFLPYLACCLTGLFYQKKGNQLFEKRFLIIALVIVSLVQISASILFLNLVKEHFLEGENTNLITKFMQNLTYSNYLNVVYSFSSVIINNLFIGTLLYLINSRLKNKLEFLYNFKTN